MRHDPLFPFLLTACLGVGLTAQAQVCPTTLPAGATGSQSLRLMNYNVFMTVAPADNSSAYGMTQAERAATISARILKDDPDIVALEEADDDDAKQAFVNALAVNGPYKHFIRKADQNNPLNDSGLMLFSKFPFGRPDAILIDGTILGSNEDWCEGESPLGKPFSNCNVKIYDQSNGADWWQNKGVVAVRAVNSCNRDAPINLAFSHTQSKGDVNDDDCTFGQDVTDLQSQLNTARKLIELSFNGTSLVSQPTFLLGDINLDGNQKGANKVTTRHRDVVLTSSNPASPGNPLPACSASKFSGVNEWQLTFDGKLATQDINNGFYACHGNRLTSQPCSYNATTRTGTLFIDSWAYQTSPEDPGQTQSGTTGGPLVFDSPNSGERVDYILHNNPFNAAGSPSLCMQYIRRGFAKSTDELSDHLPITADFNFPAPRCSPRPRKTGDSHLEPGDDANALGPEPVVFNLANPQAPNFKDVFFGNDGVTAIANPGNMQWYVIDDPGAYDIRTVGSVAFEVFQGSNLSKRLEGASVECTPDNTGRIQDCKFSLMKPPYYVRVFGAMSANPDKEDRTTFGSYTIRFHRFDCASMTEACLMEPGVQVTAAWPNTQLDPAHNSDAMYFYFHTEKAASSRFPDVSFVAEHQFDLRFDASNNFVDPLSISLLNKAGTQVVCPGCGSPGGWLSQSPEPSAMPSPLITWDNVPPLVNTWRRTVAALPETLPGVPSWPEKYFVKVSRHPLYMDQARPQFITFQTSLTYFRPIELSCIEERTWIGQDDFATNWGIGSTLLGKVQIGDVNGDFETWDEGAKMAEAGSTNGTRSPWPFRSDTSFVGNGNQGESLRPTLLEDVIDQDNYVMCEVDQGGLCGSVFKLGNDIFAKPTAEEDPANPFQTARWLYRDEISDSPYYHYEMSFKLRHQRMPCRGTSGAQSDCPAAGTACSASLPAFQWQASSPRCVCTSNVGCPSGQTCNLTSGQCVLP